jgi:hypothetical protein
MNETKATGSHLDAKMLAAKGAVKAIVLGRRATVTAIAWDPITSADEPRQDISAREILDEARDIEAQGTPKADEETQIVISRLKWNPWIS